MKCKYAIITGGDFVPYGDTTAQPPDYVECDNPLVTEELFDEVECDELCPYFGFKVITLCGSTRFKEDFMREQKRLTLKGNIVISVGCFGHSGDGEVVTSSIKEMLDIMHKRKIDMADEIYVINKNGYIGNSTKSEIAYAIAHNKPVFYMEV